MPTTDLPATSSIIVSPSQHFPPQSFTMTNYTALIAYNFKFCDHPLCHIFTTSLNNTYAELFQNSVADWFFTNANNTAVAPNVITIIRTAIIDTIMILSTADCTIDAPIIIYIHLFTYGGIPFRKFPIQTASTFATALQAIITTTHVTVVFQLDTGNIYIALNNVTVRDFTGLSLTGPICHINALTAATTATAPGVVGAGATAGATATAAAGSSPLTAAQGIATTAVTG